MSVIVILKNMFALVHNDDDAINFAGTISTISSSNLYDSRKTFTQVAATQPTSLAKPLTFGATKTAAA